MADRCGEVQQWALNITTKLSNDPTLPAFKEFVQVHGFLFLEEFLEDALRGPKDQTIIDLAKTPGRRKDVPKTTRAAAVALAASQKKIKALHFSKEDKENQPHSPRHNPQDQHKPVMPSYSPRLKSPRSFPALAITNRAGTRDATSCPVASAPVHVQSKSAAEQGNLAGPSAVPLARASTVPNLNLNNHESAAPQHQPSVPLVRSSWLREALVPGAPKQTMGAALIAQAKKSMGVQPPGMGIGIARASGVKRKSDSVDFEDQKEERMSKSSKKSYYGGTTRTSEAPVLVPAVEATASDERPRPVEQQPVDDIGMTDFEIEVGGEDDNRGRTTISKLAEAIREGNSKRLARSTIHQQVETAQHQPVDIDLTGRFNIHMPSPSQPRSTVSGSVEAVPDSKIDGPSQPQVFSVLAIPTDEQKRSLVHERLSISDLVGSSQPSVLTKAKKNAKIPEGRALTGAKPFTLLADSIASTTTPENSPPRAKLTVVSGAHRAQAATATTATVTDVVNQDLKDPSMALSPLEEMILGLGGNKAAVPNVEQSAQLPTNLSGPTRVPDQEAAGLSTLLRAPPAFVDMPDNSLTSDVCPFETLPRARCLPLASAQQPPLATQATSAPQTSTQTTFADSIFATSQPMARTQAYDPEMDPFSQTSTCIVSQEIVVSQSKDKERQSGLLVEAPPPPETERDHAPPTAGSSGYNIFSNEEDEVGIAADESESDTDEEQPAQTGISASTSMGLLGSAASFVAKAFGGPAKKSLQVDHLKALNAAKKDQEEKEKKKARTIELMEQRRLAAVQKKAEEEKARQAELERKKKEETEKRKRDRDDMNNSKIGNKAKREEEPSKKRKVTAETDKLKKAPSKDKLNVSNLASTAAIPAINATRAPPPRPPSQQAQYTSSSQPAVKTILKKPSGFFACSSQPTQNSVGPAPSGPSFGKLPPSFQRPSPSVKAIGTAGPSSAAPVVPASTTGKTLNHPAAPANTQDKQQPSQALRSDMQARVQAQLAKKNRDAALASEQIELPEINSEYEDSDDEERNKTTLPDWAQSPVLRQQLIDQSTIDPEEYFGAIPELKMEEIFKKGRVSKFRARTSSANWNGADKLTLHERREYAKNMGYFK
ncbi:hypothetical protein FRB93_005464 [Tulasnella sp. JGI-2019a]|nr:hypothetical protein FRB93_005464 [Tulasnella sp. JGI-2019a]